MASRKIGRVILRLHLSVRIKNPLKHDRRRQFGVAIIGIMPQSIRSEFHRNRRGHLIFFPSAVKEGAMVSVDGSDKEIA